MSSGAAVSKVLGTSSPGLKRVTAAPTLSTVPATPYPAACPVLPVRTAFSICCGLGATSEKKKIKKCGHSIMKYESKTTCRSGGETAQNSGFKESCSGRSFGGSSVTEARSPVPNQRRACSDILDIINAKYIH